MRQLERTAMAPQADYLEFDDSLVDFAVAAYQEDGHWDAVGLPPHVAESLDAFLSALHQQVSEGPTIGLVGLGDEYFVAARPVGARVLLFLSDVAAAVDDRIAGDVLDRVDPGADPRELADGPIGDQDMFADLGLDPLELAFVCERLQREPEFGLGEAVGGIASRLGFGEQFAHAARRDEQADQWLDG
ncbi:tRNA adenosine deaminase-associated protein [Actinocrinis puniceicyclus]|uniref:tRNA adenosine deaminase-associated protein n=1 Tax=Actinocrinis puniceicyclus TaxID=977794 RepID=A0A8J7WN90_9ACTN|nr:tRNA adenosine deaminase-associated protein [Actinocrinis puniceicyclus]MBS2964443.1 tRNA adenosine deaminase-associated protein [Actinocrinis puniceicyclus]